MLLIVGGAGQGKLNIALEQTGCTVQDVGEDGLIVDSLHLLIRERLAQGRELSTWLEQMLPKQAVVCDELGCGVVPADAFERRWREEVGHACQFLARHARRVVRVTCGIPMVLKESSRPSFAGNTEKENVE